MQRYETNHYRILKMVRTIHLIMLRSKEFSTSSKTNAKMEWYHEQRKKVKIEFIQIAWVIQYDKIFWICKQKSYQFQPIKALQCAEIKEDNLDSYTFVRPDDNWSWELPSQEDLNSYNFFEAGHSLQVSASCNSNFIYAYTNNNHGTPISIQYDCDEIKYHGGCDLRVTQLIKYGQWNTNGIYETFLQCPACGCGSEGAANLNDVYTAEQDGYRKVSDVANTIFNGPLQ